MKENPYQRVFFPQIVEKVQKIQSEKIKFVHYTSAEAAMGIIKNEEVWLRNTICMNDFAEVAHGIACLRQSLTEEEAGEKFKEHIDKMFPGLFEGLIRKFVSLLPKFRSETYIFCVSEHHSSDDLYGKLSMWRAYGGNNPVALVLNPSPLLGESAVLKIFSYPIDYDHPDNFGPQIDNLRKRLEENYDYILELGKNKVGGALFSVFRGIAICTKHPGFMEELEWRVVYNPTFDPSDRLRQEIEVIGGVPQEVCKISLKEFSDKDFVGGTIPDLIDKIIIGPTDQQSVTGKALKKLLKEAGCEDAEERIRYSEIPLR